MRNGLWLASVITVALLSVGCAAQAQETTQKPNILFILTDDQDEESIARMDKLQDRLVNQGTTFENAFVTTPQCCPSRVTFLRGQYAHNHRILSNNPPLGGFEKFHKLGLERSTIATWLHEAGYATAYVGKYLNGYGEKRPTRYIPPGWDRWWARLGGIGNDTYDVNENGHIKIYDRHKLNETDYYSDRAEEFVRNHNGEGAPWFMVVAPTTPHSPAYVAERHEGMFKNAEMPKPPSFNEADVSDKPVRVRGLPRLSAQGVARVEEYWRKRQRALQSVDDLVGNLVGALAETNQLDDTYVVYASDNGYLLYRHRIRDKGGPYEESIGVPLIVRGPGVPADAARSELVANTDWAPTMAEWAQVEPPGFVDGRSFAPLLSQSPPASWRQRLLIEMENHAFRALRTAEGETYVEYRTGEKEYYELATDPWQVDSAHAAPENSRRLEALSKALSELEDCVSSSSVAATCRQKEDASLTSALP
jgi:N-acetylglucosamine-6-sulfatase